MGIDIIVIFLLLNSLPRTFLDKFEHVCANAQHRAFERFDNCAITGSKDYVLTVRKGWH